MRLFFRAMEFTSLALRGAVVASPFLFFLNNILVAPGYGSTFEFVLVLVLPVIFGLILFKNYYTFVRPGNCVGPVDDETQNKSFLDWDLARNSEVRGTPEYDYVHMGEND